MSPADGSFSIHGWTFTAVPDTIIIEGSSGADTITGNDNASADFIGGPGADHLVGGAQPDTFEYNNPGDVQAGESIDGGDSGPNSIYVSGGNSYDFSVATITRITEIQFADNGNAVTLAGSQIGTGHIDILLLPGNNASETLRVIGSTVNLSGLFFDSNWDASDRIFIVGTGGRDVLVGSGFNDRIDGKAGKDILTGGPGADHFVFDTAPNRRTNLDHITDFHHNVDHVDVSAAIFHVRERVNGHLKSVPLKINGKTVYAAAGATQAHDTNDHFIYNKTTGGLYFDKDGKGGAASVEIAILDHHPVFNFHDMLIVA